MTERDPAHDPQAGDVLSTRRYACIRVLRVTEVEGGEPIVVARYSPGPPHCPKFFTLSEWRSRYARP